MVRVYIHSAEECVIAGDDFKEVTVVKTAIDNLGIVGFLNKCVQDNDKELFKSELCGTVTVEFHYE